MSEPKEYTICMSINLLLNAPMHNKLDQIVMQ